MRKARIQILAHSAILVSGIVTLGLGLLLQHAPMAFAAASSSASSASKPCSSSEILSDNSGTDPCISQVPSSDDIGGTKNDIIAQYVNPFIDFLAGAVGLVVTISIVAAGIQYASSADDPSKVAAAKKRITNAITALLAFLFLYAFLQWLIPGGILNS